MRERKRESGKWKNKAGYTATKVACGGQGPYLKPLLHLGRSNEAKDRKNPKEVKFDGSTDQRTDEPTKRGVKSRSTRLKIGDDERIKYLDLHLGIRKSDCDEYES